MKRITFVFILGLSAVLSADPIIRKLDPLRFQHERDASGKYHLVDLWMKLSDLYLTARYNPTTSNVYHLFTRQNPVLSQPLLFNNTGLLQSSNFNSNRRTAVLIHGWSDNVIGDFNTVIVPALLSAEDLNVIAVDWSAGSNTINLPVQIENCIASGRAVANFINWLNKSTGSTPSQFHIIGHGIGGHQAGLAGRNVEGDVGYITALDPSLVGWVNHNYRFHPDDGEYTEVIHTNCAVNGYLADLGQVDFYPNGGESMPGCSSHACDHARSYFYFAESIVSGGFTGRECSSYFTAILHMCNSLPGRLQMGGLTPKNGQTGVYLLETNAAPPFSRG
ncbi:pancreatic triacylglycerol lipase-like [Vanessa tameamea]|uniref:Pancreatic triacylglycerol lipase-like n=1 Tax=Vanessa tameamea TaxID=334116 RepID=A0A8B8ICH7_VANTA